MFCDDKFPAIYAIFLNISDLNKRFTCDIYQSFMLNYKELEEGEIRYASIK